MLLKYFSRVPPAGEASRPASGSTTVAASSASSMPRPPPSSSSAKDESGLMPFLEAIIRDEDELKQRQQMRHIQQQQHKQAAVTSKRPMKKQKTCSASLANSQSVINSTSRPASGSTQEAEDACMDPIESFPVEPENIDPSGDISKRHSLPSSNAQINRLSIQVSPNASAASSFVPASTSTVIRQASMDKFVAKKKKKLKSFVQPFCTFPTIHRQILGRRLPEKGVPLQRYSLVGCGHFYRFDEKRKQAFELTPRLDTQARVHEYVRSSRRYPRSAAALTCLEFDRDGVLLVGSEPKGGIRVFDFDSYLPKAMTFGNQISPTERLQPIHCIESRDMCKCLSWHPTNMNYVVAGFRNRSALHIYDLGDFPQDPLLKLESGSNSRSGCMTLDLLCFAASWRHGGGAPNVAAAGGKSKVVRIWDMRQSGRHPSFVFGTQSLISGDPPDVNALSYCSARGLLFLGDSDGGITAVDMRKPIVQTFSHKKLPKKHSSIPLRQVLSQKKGYGAGIASLACDPSGSGHVAFRMQNGTVGVVESSTHRSANGMRLVGMLEKKLVPNQTKESSQSQSTDTDTDIPCRPPILPMPTRTLKYMYSRQQSMLCVGEHNKCRLKLVPIDGRALSNSKEVCRLKGTHVELEYDAATCGGGVSALAYHKATDSVVACMDNGSTVVACAHGRV